MKTWQKIAIAGGGIAAALGVTALLMGGAGAGSPILQIEASDGGTTNPAPSPSGIPEPLGAVITITATPDSGYTIGSWTIDGIPLTNQANSIQVTMDTNHWVTISFWLGGVPPPSTPAFIVPVGGSPTAWGFYAAKVEIHWLDPVPVAVRNCDQNWTWDNWAQYPVQFKVIDAAGRGVPGVDVSLYPDTFPDNGNNRGLIGYLALNLWPHTNQDPLIVQTDENGIASLTITYVYGNNDAMLKLCQAGQLYLWVGLGPFALPMGIEVKDGASTANATIILSKGGEGITNDYPDTMGGFALNYIRASIPRTAIPATSLPVYCGFHVKML